MWRGVTLSASLGDRHGQARCFQQGEAREKAVVYLLMLSVDIPSLTVRKRNSCPCKPRAPSQHAGRQGPKTIRKPREVVILGSFSKVSLGPNPLPSDKPRGPLPLGRRTQKESSRHWRRPARRPEEKNKTKPQARRRWTIPTR